MWEVYEHKRVSRQLKRLPIDILKRYEKWKDIVEIAGPDGLRMIKGFRDEALSGEWKGFRSSRLNLQYRVIYTAKEDFLEVHVVELTPHEYRRR